MEIANQHRPHILYTKSLRDLCAKNACRKLRGRIFGCGKRPENIMCCVLLCFLLCCIWVVENFMKKSTKNLLTLAYGCDKIKT